MTAGRPLMPRSNEGSGAPGAQQEMAKVPDGANPTGKKGHVAAVAAGYKENSPQIVAAMRPGLFMPQQPKQARLGVKILKAPEEAQQSNTQESGDTESNDNREQSCSENPVPEKDKDKVNSHAPGE